MEEIKNILIKRADDFRKGDYKSVFDLYAPDSDFRRFFPDEISYGEHFSKLIRLNLPESIEIYKVLADNNTAEVLYTEKIKSLESGCITIYYSKTEFERFDMSWKIVREKREACSLKA